jgi:hypothetical protein
VIATKVYGRTRPGPNGAGISRKAIFAGMDNSLHRLGMDYVDLYQIHRFDHATPIEETLEALHDIVKAGKVRFQSGYRGGCPGIDVSLSGQRSRMAGVRHAVVRYASRRSRRDRRLVATRSVTRSRGSLIGEFGTRRLR